MSGFTRKTLLLKTQPNEPTDLTVKNFTVIRYRYFDNLTIFELQVPVFKSDSECDLVVFNGQTLQRFSFYCGNNNGETQEFSAKLDAENGICAAIFVGNTPSAPLFFGSNLNKKITPTEIKDLYEKNYKKNDETGGKPQNAVFQPEKTDELSKDAQAGKPLTKDGENDTFGKENSDEDIFIAVDDAPPIDECMYDDEALATENYYEIKTDESPKKEVTDDNLHSTAAHIGQSGTDTTKQAQNDGNIQENGAAFRTCPFSKPEPKFYAEKRGEIEELFTKYEAIGSLSQYIPESKWVKIEYKKDGFYIIGVIRKDGVPQYIVYGVPGRRGIRPRGFERYSVFLPESLFTTDDRGFWCSFQSAETGKVENPG